MTLQFLYPNVLFLMLLPLILLMYLILTNKDSFQKYFSTQTLQKLSVANKHMTKSRRNILFFIALILMTLALARPVANEKEQSFKQEVSSIVVAIDVSKSMLANDIYPNRLTLAKQKLLNIIDNSKNNAIAVILFAKSSFILSPVTQDLNSLKILVDNLDTGINFDNGSNIFSTLESTNKLLKDYKNKNLVLLSDGGNNTSFEKEIEYANKHNINIYTIALATKKAAPIKLDNGEFLTNKDGSIVTVSLNENIKKLSLKTNGGYINYSINNEDIRQILLDIERKSVKKELESKKFKTYTELFYYPLALSLVFLLIAFSSLPSFFLKSNKNLILALLSIFFLTDSKALEFDFKTINKANEAYEKQEYKEASKSFEKVAHSSEAKYNLANSLYKEGKYKEALKQYKEVITTNEELEYRKLHNMANSYVKLNDLESAKNLYENALKIKDDKETKENLEAVLKELEKIKKQENKEQKQEKDNKNNQKEQEKKKQENKQKQEKQDSKQKEQNSQNKSSKKEKEKQQEEQKNQKQKTQEQSAQNKKMKKEEISELEEQKWLNRINNERKPVLLKKVDTKNEDNSSNPW